MRRATLSALVVMDVHSRDVAATLASEEGVAGHLGSFSWTSQLRHYFEPASGGGSSGGGSSGSGGSGGSSSAQHAVVLRMMNASVGYGYEYLGNR